MLGQFTSKLLRRWFALARGVQAKPAQRTVTNKARLGLEALEDRQLMTVNIIDIINRPPITLGGNSSIQNGELVVHAGLLARATPTNTHVSFQRLVSGSMAYVVNMNGNEKVFMPEEITTGIVRFTGSPGADNFSISARSLRVVAHGGDGDDTISGSIGNDTLAGEGNNDQIFGQEGNDEIYGNDGDDRIWAGDGLDTVYGGWGNDDLYGERHDDALYGEGNDDGLFGGIGDNDHLEGGPGVDRFLNYHSEDNTQDWGGLGSEDALIHFINGDRTTMLLNGANVTFQPGTWTNDEIQRVDEALGVLHHRTGNDNLLENTDGSVITFKRLGTSGTNFLGYNEEGGKPGRIALSDNAFSSRFWTLATVWHEVGHFWDETSFAVNTFRTKSDWRSTNPNSMAFTQSGDGSGWYRTSLGQFARNYGSNSANDDWCVTWEAYFAQRIGLAWGTDGTGAAAIPQKITDVDQWMTSKSGAAGIIAFPDDPVEEQPPIVELPPMEEQPPVEEQPAPPPARGVQAMLVAVRQGRKVTQMVRVIYTDTGEVKQEYRSPFQPGKFKGVTVAAQDTDGDGLADSIVVTARRGKRLVTQVLEG